MFVLECINILEFKQIPFGDRVPSYLWPRTMNGLPPIVMNSLPERLRQVQEQVSRLVRDHLALQKKVSEQEAMAHEHHRTVEVLKARVAELERENEVLRSARSADGGSARPGTKERIDELVHEIDRCLALING